MLVKAGVDISRLKRAIRKSLCVVEKYMAKEGYELVITSTYDSNHLACSYHYGNDAYDFRWKRHYKIKVIENIRKELGDDFDVILEVDHVHVEYDPKGNRKLNLKRPVLGEGK